MTRASTVSRPPDLNAALARVEYLSVFITCAVSVVRVPGLRLVSSTVRYLSTTESEALIPAGGKAQLDMIVGGSQRIIGILVSLVVPDPS